MTASTSIHTSKAYGHSSVDRLKVTCHHGNSEFHEVETTLDFAPSGPSQLELYAEDEQSHERIAIGLKSYRKLGQHLRGSGRRVRSNPRLRKKRIATKEVVEKRAEEMHNPPT